MATKRKGPRLLDLFCGAGGAAMGYWRAGFEVVGVDIKPQPRYPFEMYCADALTFPIEGFDAIHASPPCQRYTQALNLNPSRRAEHPDLMEPTRERLERSGLPWVMENVPGAPMRDAFILCGTMFGLRTPCGAELRRHRLFETNWEIGLVPACDHGTGGTLAVTGTGAPVSGGRTIMVVGCVPRDPAEEKRRRIQRTISVTGATPQRCIKTRVVTVAGDHARGGGCSYAQCRETFSVDDARVAMGIDWMPMKALSQAIPPAYTEFIGRRLMEGLVWRRGLGFRVANG